MSSTTNTKDQKKRKPLSGILVAALVYLEAENYTAVKTQIGLALKHLDDKLEIS